MPKTTVAAIVKNQDKGELKILLQGGCIEKGIDENIVYQELKKRYNVIWSFLLFGGYLKPRTTHFYIFLTNLLQTSYQSLLKFPPPCRKQAAPWAHRTSWIQLPAG